MSTRPQSKRGSTQRKSYTSTTVETCAGCNGEIPAGQSFWRGITKEAWHKECRALGVKTPLYTPARYAVDSPVGKPCEGCGFTIEADEPFITRLTLPWHKECARRT